MSRQSEYFDRAAECERLMDAASDPDDRGILELSRDRWIMLANESAAMSPDYVTKQIAELEKIAARFEPVTDE